MLSNETPKNHHMPLQITLYISFFIFCMAKYSKITVTTEIFLTFIVDSNLLGRNNTFYMLQWIWQTILTGKFIGNR